MEQEKIAPFTKSPLDSSRGRGKARSPRKATLKNAQTKNYDSFQTVVLFIQNETSPVVEIRHGK